MGHAGDLSRMPETIPASPHSIAIRIMKCLSALSRTVLQMHVVVSHSFA